MYSREEPEKKDILISFLLGPATGPVLSSSWYPLSAWSRDTHLNPGIEYCEVVCAITKRKLIDMF